MIDRDKLLEKIQYSDQWNNAKCPDWVYAVVRATPDEVEIYWCEGCSHHRESHVYPGKLFCGYIEAYVKPGNFCCWGNKNG